MYHQFPAANLRKDFGVTVLPLLPLSLRRSYLGWTLVRWVEYAWKIKNKQDQLYHTIYIWKMGGLRPLDRKSKLRPFPFRLSGPGPHSLLYNQITGNGGSERVPVCVAFHFLT
jgi:hypothetical protein